MCGARVALAMLESFEAFDIEEVLGKPLGGGTNIWDGAKCHA